MGKRSKKHNYAKGWETRRRNAAARARQTPKIETAQAALNDIRRSSLNGLADNRGMLNPAMQAQAVKEARTWALGGPVAPAVAPLSDLDIKAHAIMAAARRKDGEKAVKDALERHGLESAYEAHQASRRSYAALADEQSAEHAIVIISGFMAMIEVMSGLNGGGLPPAIVVTGVSAARVYDALKKFGYTKEGFKTQRDTVMAKTPSEIRR